MKKLRFALLTLAALLLLCTPVLAAQDLRFSPVGGGKFIYCNNEEDIFQDVLLNGAKPAYIMNNENLGPDRYYLYLSHFNFTGFAHGSPNNTIGFGYDVELDVEMTAVEDSVIRIDNAAFETPRNYAYLKNGQVTRYEDEWGCFLTCTDMLGVPLYALDGENRYFPTPYEPKTITIKKGETVWLSEYLNRYDAVHFGKAVHIQADLTIESGKMNLNVGAFRSGKTIGDRSGFNKNAAFGTYKRDTCIKGIADTLPEVVAPLSYEITDDMAAGTCLPVTVYNQYMPDGNKVEGWMTNLNPQNDIWSKVICAESDMIPILYKDPSKLEFYGKNVSESEKDDVWVFDCFHSNTKGYEAAFNTGDAADYRPNFKITADKDNLNTSCSLGNYGVATTYKITAENKGDKTRYMALNITTASAIIGYTSDENGKKDKAFLKNVSAGKETAVLCEQELLPHTTSTFYFTTILPVNYNGGTLNQLVLSDESTFKQVPYAERQECEYDNGVPLAEIDLPEDTLSVFDGSLNSFSYLRGEKNALVRWTVWDGKPYYEYNLWGYSNSTYLLSPQGKIVGSSSFTTIPVSSSYAKGVYYLTLADGSVVSSKDGLTWTPYGGQMPAYEPAAPWYDLKNASDWAVSSLSDGFEKGIILNYLSDGFHFTDNITRKDFCSLALCFLKAIDMVPRPAISNFADIDDETVNTLVATGVIYGFEDGTFRPDEEITREQAAAILSRLMRYVKKSATKSDEKHVYADQSDISDWAVKAVDDMYFSGIMLGAEDNQFQPNEPYTREQAAITVTRLLDFCTKPEPEKPDKTEDKKDENPSNPETKDETADNGKTNTKKDAAVKNDEKASDANI